MKTQHKKMMALAGVLSISVMAATTVAHAESDVHGLRLEGGFSHLDAGGKVTGKDTGYAAGLGWDINKYVGLTGMVTTSEIDRVDHTSAQLKTDIGYTFTPVSDLWVKPYVTAGYGMYMTDDVSNRCDVFRGGTKCHDFHGEKDNAFVYGIGVRVTFLQTFTASLEGTQAKALGGDKTIGSMMFGYHF